MRYADIIYPSISDGPGVRVSLFTQGCHFHCPHCFNKETWSFENGHLWETKDFIHLGNILKNPLVRGLSILGGEPLEPQNLEDLYTICTNIKKIYPEKDIWIWSGFLWEDLTDDQKKVVSLCDVMVDGLFINKLKDPSLYWRGSKNQRIINVQQSIKENKVCLQLQN